MRNIAARINAGALCVCAILLFLVLWRIDAVEDRLKRPRYVGSGQIIAAPWGSTERLIIDGELEPLREWKKRHDEAAAEFGIKEGE